MSSSQPYNDHPDGVGGVGGDYADKLGIWHSDWPFQSHIFQSDRKGWGQSQGQKMRASEGEGGFPGQIQVLSPETRGILHTPQPS